MTDKELEKFKKKGYVAAINKLGKKACVYSYRAHKASRFADFVGLKGWSPDEKWVSDSNSRKPTMYIPDVITNSALGNILVSPIILLTSGFPRAFMYKMARRMVRENSIKMNDCIIERQNLIKEMINEKKENWEEEEICETTLDHLEEDELHSLNVEAINELLEEKNIVE